MALKTKALGRSAEKTAATGPSTVRRSVLRSSNDDSFGNGSTRDREGGGSFDDNNGYQPDFWGSYSSAMGGGGQVMSPGTGDGPTPNSNTALDEVVRSSEPTPMTDYGNGSTTRVRQLTPEEWNSLTTQQQQGVLANYALFEAAQKDATLQDTIPGDRVAGYDDSVKGIFGQNGSDRYAPNTLAVLQELGYNAGGKTDLDQFLDGDAFATSNDVLLNKPGEQADNREQLFQQLANGAAFQYAPYQEAVAGGGDLLSSLANSGAFTQDVLGLTGLKPSAVNRVPADKIDALNEIMDYMGDSRLWADLQTDPELGAQLQQKMDAALTGIDPTLAAQYFQETYTADDGIHMSWDDFKNNWLKGL